MANAIGDFSFDREVEVAHQETDALMATGPSTEVQCSDSDAREVELGNVAAAQSHGRGGEPLPARIGASGAGAESSGTEAKASLKYRLRLYSVWPSQNMFFCRGFLVTGGSDECWAPNLCVWGCILVPCSLYFFWIFPSLWRRGAYGLPLTILVVFLLTVGSLFATCCTDPGIIPRRNVILATGTAAQLEVALGYDVLGGVTGEVTEPQISDRMKRQGYRWCRTCKIVRPPRASHCPDCDNCVMRYDHHCPFVNNCVGQRNYHFFFSFVTLVLVLAMLVIPSVMSFFAAFDLEASLKFMIQIDSVMWIVFYVVIAFGALVIIASVLSFILWVYHLFLITTSRTTKEFRKSVPNVDEEPTLCARRGPRLFDPRALVDPLDVLGQPRSASATTV